MRSLVTIVILMIAATCLSFGQVNMATKYSYPLLPGTQQDTVLNGLSSIRGLWYDTDLDGD